MKEVENFSTKVKTLTQVLNVARQYFGGHPVHQKNLKWFESWIHAQIALSAEGLEECPKCKSDPENQAGSIPCGYCGAIGQQPWGG